MNEGLRTFHGDEAGDQSVLFLQDPAFHGCDLVSIALEWAVNWAVSVASTPVVPVVAITKELIEETSPPVPLKSDCTSSG